MGLAITGFGLGFVTSMLFDVAANGGPGFTRIQEHLVGDNCAGWWGFLLQGTQCHQSIPVAPSVQPRGLYQFSVDEPNICAKLYIMMPIYCIPGVLKYGSVGLGAVGRSSDERPSVSPTFP